MSKDLLFELGTEEIPPSSLSTVASRFRQELETRLAVKDLGYEQTNLFYTPRRIALRIQSLQEKQASKVERHRGPSKEVGLDEDGNYDLPAVKFAESHGVQASDLSLENTDEGKYFFVERKREGKETRDLLPELLIQAVNSLDQPEKMRWDSSGLTFIRPVRWCMCFYGDQILDFTIGNVTSSAGTRGHKFHGKRSVSLSAPENYEIQLKDNFVIVDPVERKQTLMEELDKKTDELDATVAVEDSFVQLLADSLEFPSLIDGSFPEDYLDLPTELLFKTLTEEARLIPMVDNSSGQPMPRFIGFRDGVPDESGKIRKGYESVINARLRDSKFFFEHDRGRSLEAYTQELKKVTFQEELGSVWDKVSRMRDMAEQLVSQLEPSEFANIDRTIALCKADLVSEVVDEFPALEGTIGAHYADLDGEPDEVVTGIKQHYKPRSSTDEVPQSSIGAIVSIVDKLDTLTGSFLLGEEPTGTRDPYGLRRKADGVIRIVIEREFSVDLYDLIDFSAGLYDLGSIKGASKRLKRYLTERLISVLKRKYDFPYDIVDAITARDDGNPYDIYLRAKSLQAFKNKPELKNLVDSFTRVVNIARDDQEGKFDPEILELQEELELWHKTDAKADEIRTLAEDQEYQEVILRLLELKDPIDRYFDNVMVMTEDEEQRKNRLNFLLKLRGLFMNVGDLSKVVTD